MDYANGLVLSYSIGYNGNLRKEQIMEANELRIGNIVLKSLKSGNGRKVETEISIQDFVRIIEDIGVFNYEPIPLTEEWLVKFGYKKQAYNGVWYHPDLNNAPALTIEDDGLYYEYTKIEHVHHFQNLCFVLTLQELELKTN
jgi:hypothetical protein